MVEMTHLHVTLRKKIQKKEKIRLPALPKPMTCNSFRKRGVPSTEHERTTTGLGSLVPGRPFRFESWLLPRVQTWTPPRAEDAYPNDESARRSGAKPLTIPTPARHHPAIEVLDCP